MGLQVVPHTNEFSPSIWRKIIERLNNIIAGDWDGIYLTDGVPAPNNVPTKAVIYIDAADGDLKIKFGDGTIKTIATDT